MAPLAPTYSALDIIKIALRSLNSLASGEEVDAPTAQDALIILNHMIDSWNAEGLMVFTTEKQVYPFVAGQQIYTYGPGGDFDAVRPQWIDSANLMLLNNPTFPVELPLALITNDQWQNTILKQLQANLPSGVYDDGGNPLRTLTYWGVPAGAISAILWVRTPLSSFQLLTTKLGFPHGYKEAIKYNLAVRLAAENFGDLTTALAAIAVESKALIQISNIKPVVLKCDDAVIGQGGWVPIYGGAWRP